jgi:hypothetical protein
MGQYETSTVLKEMVFRKRHHYKSSNYKTNVLANSKIDPKNFKTVFETSLQAKCIIN